MRHFAAILALCLGASCGVRYPDPVVTGVEPERAWNGRETVVDITGRHFYPQVWVEAGDNDEPRVDDDFSAFLVDEDGVSYALSGSVATYTRFEAVVREGLSPGVYDVVVESASGRRGTLVDGFTVSDWIADRLVLEPTTPSSTVETAISVDVYLADPMGVRVYEPGFGVELWLEDQLTGQPYLDALVVTTDIALQPGTETGRVVGVLGEAARVDVSVPDPGLYELHAAPQRDTDVADDTVLLEWKTSTIEGIRFNLPSVPFEARVGVPFDLELEWVDVFGNPVPANVGSVLLESVCSGFLGEVTVSGSATHEVVLTRPCASDTIYDIRDSDSHTDPFVVLPADPDHLQVSLPPPPFVAGTPFPVQVVVLDAFDNPVDWTGVLTLSLDSGGIQSAACTKNPFNLGQHDCSAVATVADQGVVLTVDGDSGISGVSAPFDVSANSAAIGTVEVAVAGLPRAGDAYLLEVRPIDAWGNAVDAALWPEPDWVVNDELGDASCTWLGPAGGAARYDCVPTVARRDATVTAELVPTGVIGFSPTFVVYNGDLSRVDLAVPGGPLLVAGTPFAVVVEGYDAYGNPAELLADPVVDLADDSETFTPGQATLSAGRADLQGVLTRAGNTVLRASQAGVEYGVSEVLTVAPAPTSALRVTVIDAPWAWVGVSQDVRVEAVDGWGNRTTWTGTTDLASRSTATPPLQVAVTNGVGTAAFTWVEPALDDVIDATGGGWAGQSDALDVARDCGASGPFVVVDFAGFPEAVACVDPVTGTAATSASFAGSSAGAAPLVRYDLAIEGGEVVRSAVNGVVFDLPGTGIHPLRALVVDSLGCGAEVASLGFAGPDDGQAVGPIDVAPDLPVLVAGVDTTVVEVRDVTDCSRDLAVGATVFARTTLGDLTGLSATGAGLAGLTDATGALRPTLDATGLAGGGSADVHVWVASGAARGEGHVSVSGDALRPTVWWQEPNGEVLDNVSEVTLQFSEPMLAGSFSLALITVTGPSAVNVNGVAFDPTGTIATLSLAPPADGADGTWIVTLPPSVRDLAGNRLSGNWTGLASTYQGVFGDVGAPVDPVSCVGTTPSDGVFRPDGDDGVGREADAVGVALQAVVAPAWWEVDVSLAGGGTLRMERAVPVGAIDDWVWDGRDQGGQIVANGAYEIAVTPVDGQGNRGGGCVASVVVDNRLGSAP